MKDSAFWLLFMDVPFCYKVSQDKEYIGKIKDSLVENLKFTGFYEVIINTYTFNFLTEFFLVPFVVILVTLNAFPATNEEYKPAKNLMDKILYFLGIIICYYFLKELWMHFSDISNDNFIKNYFLPFFYTMFFTIPAVLLKRYSEY